MAQGSSRAPPSRPRRTPTSCPSAGPRRARGGRCPASLPLYGRIAAGTPIEALRDHATQVQVPPHLLGQGDHYALEVVGDSMVDAGNPGRRSDRDRAVGPGEQRRHRGRVDRRHGGHVEAAAVQGPDDRAGGGEPAVRDPDLRAEPGQGSRSPDRLDAPHTRRRPISPGRSSRSARDSIRGSAAARSDAPVPVRRDR